jgi:hypothetical protein
VIPPVRSSCFLGEPADDALQRLVHGGMTARFAKNEQSGHGGEWLAIRRGQMMRLG